MEASHDRASSLSFFLIFSGSLFMIGLEPMPIDVADVILIPFGFRRRVGVITFLK
jgi:hypothetical protein